jgi:hypothetical protein
MPIHKKDRSFQNIVRDVDIDEIPLDYIERLILVLQNGDRVIFEGEDLQDVDEPNIVLFIMSAVDDLGEDYGSPVSDIEIVIDYNRLEEEINKLTKNLLDKDTNDSSDTSV